MRLIVTITKVVEWEQDKPMTDGDEETERNDMVVMSILEDLTKFVDGASWDIIEVVERGGSLGG